MIRQFFSLSLLAFSGASLGQPHQLCLTNELTGYAVTANLALEIGKCHLAQALPGVEGLQALEYAHSWFLQARYLGAAEAQAHLEATEVQLSKIEEGK